MSFTPLDECVLGDGGGRDKRSVLRPAQGRYTSTKKSLNEVTNARKDKERQSRSEGWCGEIACGDSGEPLCGCLDEAGKVVETGHNRGNRNVGRVHEGR